MNEINIMVKTLLTCLLAHANNKINQLIKIVAIHDTHMLAL